MKKGFTLVELLGVIVILTVIGFIAVPTVLNMYRGSKEELSDLTEQVLITSTKSYVNDNENDFPINNGNVYCVSLKRVVSENYLKTPVIDSNTGEEIDLNKIVQVKVTNGNYDISLNDSCVIYINEPFTMSVPSGVVNEYGWAKEDFNVGISGNGLTAYKYCISDKMCKPNIEVNASSGLIPINTEGIHYLCAHGINAEGNTDVQCNVYRLDKTDPVIGSIALSGTEGLNGYYVSNVYVSNTPSTDALSGILTDVLNPNAGNVTTDTEGTLYTLTATDKAGNTSSTSYTLKIDKTIPDNGLVEFIGTKGDNDWYISDVTVKLNNTDEYTMSSNISSITSDTKGTTVTVKTIDKAGNENPKDYVIKVDKTKPVIGTFNIVGVLGDNGWYTSDVTISAIDGSDTISGHVSSTVDVNSITTNTDGTVVTLTTKNGAGLTNTDTVTIMVDKEKPTLTAKDGPFEIYVGDNVDSKTYFNTPTYSISGQASYECSPSNTSSLAEGTQTITCTATGGNGLHETASVEIEVINPVYLVTLDNQSATSAGTTSINATYGSAMPSITVPTRTGYTFGGYYTGTNGSGTQYYTATGASARNWDQYAEDTLYAKWTINTYAVTLSVTNGTGGSTKNINYGSNGTWTITANSLYAVDGATFSPAGCGTISGSTVTISNVTSAKTCTITLPRVLLCTVGTPLGECLRTSKPTGFNSSAQGGMYRFQGETVDNYVCFGTTDKSTCVSSAYLYMYRILGVASAADTTTTVEADMTKILLDSAFDTNTTWASGNATWPNSNIYKELNTTYIDEWVGYYGTAWNSKIATIKWRYGDSTGYNTTAANMYSIENKFSSTVSAKIALMYVHDIYYAYSGGKNCSSDSGNTCQDNWITASADAAGIDMEWLMTRYGYYSSSGYYNIYGNAYSLGDIYSVLHQPPTGKTDFRPTFYLNTTVTYQGGMGTADNPILVN